MNIQRSSKIHVDQRSQLKSLFQKLLLGTFYILITGIMAFLILVVIMLVM